MALETSQSQKWSDLCMDAALAASECADWCIQNDQPTDCVRACLDVSTIATATATTLERESKYMVKLLDACFTALETCASHCQERRDAHTTLDRCTDACQAAAQACRGVAKAQGGEARALR